jgi:hypothetical protein
MTRESVLEMTLRATLAEILALIKRKEMKTPGDSALICVLDIAMSVPLPDSVIPDFDPESRVVSIDISQVERNVPNPSSSLYGSLGNTRKYKV